jgi:hypothetical protein
MMSLGGQSSLSPRIVARRFLLGAGVLVALARLVGIGTGNLLHDLTTALVSVAFFVFTAVVCAFLALLCRAQWRVYQAHRAALEGPADEWELSRRVRKAGLKAERDKKRLESAQVRSGTTDLPVLFEQAFVHASRRLARRKDPG